MGEFCWINMLTPEPAAARAFFGKLLSWTYVEMPGMGHSVQVGERNIGGLFDVVSPQTPNGTPAVIGVMVKVDSADAACEQVTSLGGKAMPAFDIMDQGRMAVCFDPNGANFDVWEPKKSHGTDADPTLHGAPSWFETRATDVARAANFYSGLFGWNPEAIPVAGSTYTRFNYGTAPVAGMTEISAAEMTSHWATYFTVSDVDETAREAVDLGAEVSMPVRDLPGIGRVCGISSPQGVAFYAIEPMH